MTREPRAALCPRLFEVEALRDGRLQGAERSRFARHVQACEHCAAEARELEALGHRLRESTTQPSDELHARRERTRLLAAFDQRLMQPASERWHTHKSAWLGACALVLIGLSSILWQPWRSEADTTLTRLAASPATSKAAVELSSVVEVQPEPGTQWERRVVAGRELVEIRAGTLRLRVQRAADRLPLLLVLPDGELEDIGTTFSVTVTDGRTERVAVEEGSVLLRLRANEPVAISPSKVWVAQLKAEAPAARAIAAADSNTPGIRGPRQAALDPNQTDVDSAATAFRAAMAALNAQNPRQAAELFAHFVARHPKDGRAEDAAYMRVVALRRAGEVEAARRAARGYLVRYPHGFRSTEMNAQAVE